MNDQQRAAIEDIAPMFNYKAGALYWNVRPSRAVKIGDRAGSVDSSGYRVVRVKGRVFREHQIIYFIIYGCRPEAIDHINGDRTDNRIENLRAANKSTNGMNSKTRSNNTSGVKGVSWKAELNKWFAQLKANGKYVWSAYFNTLEEAATAIAAAREQHHGEFANHG